MTLRIGVDVGQRTEASGLCVVQAEERSDPHGSETHLVVRHLVREDGNERYGAFRVGPQDDLVTALGLGCQPEPPGPGIFAMDP